MRRRKEEIYEIRDKEHSTITIIYVFAKPKIFAMKKVYFLVQGIMPFKELKGIIKKQNKELYDFIQEHEKEYCQIHVNLSQRK